MKSKKEKVAKVKPLNANEFVNENRECFEYMTKYYPVFKALINSVSGKEIAILTKECPCKYRQKADEPFKVVCDANIDGEKIKTLKQCESCKFRQA